MSGPTIGIGRITIPYTVSGLTHELRMYAADPQLVSSTWHIAIRPDVGGTADWANAAQGLLDAFTPLLSGSPTVGTAVLEEYAATGWLPRDTATLTLGTTSGNPSLAGQITLTLRAENFTRPKIVVMEPNQVLPFHYDSPTGGAGGLDAFVDAFLGSSSVAGRPWFFMTNMHGFFLREDSFVSVSGTYNRKLRRARGLA